MLAEIAEVVYFTPLPATPSYPERDAVTAMQAECQFKSRVVRLGECRDPSLEPRKLHNNPFPVQ